MLVVLAECRGDRDRFESIARAANVGERTVYEATVFRELHALDGYGSPESGTGER